MVGTAIPPEWTEDARCVGFDTAIFFPEVGGGAAAATQYAKNICGDCPVRAQCLAFAIKLKTRHGVWGGLDERERRKLVRQHRQVRQMAVA